MAGAQDAPPERRLAAHCGPLRSMYWAQTLGPVSGAPENTARRAPAPPPILAPTPRNEVGSGRKAWTWLWGCPGRDAGHGAALSGAIPEVQVLLPPSEGLPLPLSPDKALVSCSLRSLSRCLTLAEAPHAHGHVGGSIGVCAEQTRKAAGPPQAGTFGHAAKLPSPDSTVGASWWLRSVCSELQVTRGAGT